jgi:hypothetical protein
MVRHTDFAKIDQQLCDRVPGDAGHAGCRADAVSLDKSCHNPNPLFLTHCIHIEHYA